MGVAELTMINREELWHFITGDIDNLSDLCPVPTPKIIPLGTTSWNTQNKYITNKQDRSHFILRPRSH